jgi:hypothetical protein
VSHHLLLLTKNLWAYPVKFTLECKKSRVITTGLPQILIEIKFSSAPVLSRGFHIAWADLGTKKHFVIEQVSRNYPLKNGVEVIGASLIPEMFR